MSSTISVVSDGIPISSNNDDIEQEQYEWNSEGEREIPDDRVEEIPPPSEQEQEQGSLEPGEPGYDLDDDGLPGEPLPPLAQERRTLPLL